MDKNEKRQDREQKSNAKGISHDPTHNNEVRPGPGAPIHPPPLPLSYYLFMTWYILQFSHLAPNLLLTSQRR